MRDPKSLSASSSNFERGISSFLIPIADVLVHPLAGSTHLPLHQPYRRPHRNREGQKAHQQARRQCRSLRRLPRRPESVQANLFRLPHRPPLSSPPRLPPKAQAQEVHGHGGRTLEVSSISSGSEEDLRYKRP